MFSEETSLVIPTRNRPKYLKKTLDQINKLKINFLEIIVVDSSDKKYENEINTLINQKLLNSLKVAINLITKKYWN